MKRKCSTVALCDTMAQTVQREPDKKGLVYVQLVNIATFEKTRRFIVYKHHHQEPGLALNFCPWCKGKLHRE